MRPLYVLREREPPADTLVSRSRAVSWGDTRQGVASIIFSPIYDEALGDPLGQVDRWMSETDLRTWIEQRLALLNLPDEYVLVPPVGWYRDRDYNES